jgi:hypothetical protein
MRIRLSVVCPLVAVALSAPLAACKTWQPTTMTPERLLVEARPASVRVTVSGGGTVTLRNPVIVDDSIVSSVAPPPGAVVAPPRLGVVSEDVRSLEVARFSATRTIGLMAAIALASIGWASVAGDSAGGSPPPGGQLPKGLALGPWSGVQLVWRVLR